jgi:transcriptional regulator GlxA family with amidase domain
MPDVRRNRMHRLQQDGMVCGPPLVAARIGKLERARPLLSQAGARVQTVAVQCGFADRRI